MLRLGLGLGLTTSKIGQPITKCDLIQCSLDGTYIVYLHSDTSEPEYFFPINNKISISPEL